MVGFLCYEISSDELVCCIDIISIKEDCRKKGYGKFLVDNCFELFNAKEIAVLEIECSPPDSQSYWEKTGFKIFEKEMKPRFSHGDHNVVMYYPLKSMQN